MRRVFVVTALCAVNIVISSSQTYDDVIEFEEILRDSHYLAQQLPDSEEVKESLRKSVNELNAVMESLSKMTSQDNILDDDNRDSMRQLCESLISVIQGYLNGERPGIRLGDDLHQRVNQFPMMKHIAGIWLAEMENIKREVYQVDFVMTQNPQNKRINFLNELLEQVRAHARELGQLSPTADLSVHIQELKRVQNDIQETIRLEMAWPDPWIYLQISSTSQENQPDI